MTNTNTFKAVMITAICAALPAAADPLPKPVQGMECIVGAWKGAGTLTMGKDKLKVDVSIDCKRTSARFGIACQLHMTGGGMPAYEESDLFGYDPGTNSYHWFSVTNAGETHDHVAPYSDAPKIHWVYSGTQEGKPFKEVIEMEFGKDEKSLAVHGESFVGGAATSVLQVAVRK